MLRITVYTTYISVPADSEGYTLDIAGNPIPCYHIGQLLQKLKEGEYDQRQKRYVVQCKYYTYAPGRKELRLPRFMLQTLLDDLQRVNIPVDLVDGMVVTPRAVQMYLNPKWDDRNELQTAAIAFLLRSDLPMRSLSVQPGVGKTYCSNKAMVYRSHAALIITDGLIDQWKEALLEQTLLDEKSIYIIQGAKSIKWLWLNPDYQPAVFIASQDTLRAYALGVAEPYDIFPTYAEFLATYGIGWKTLDEFHLNFGANTQIDLRSNVEDNIYLSATPKRSSRQGKEIFDRIFPKVIRFGEEEYDKYVDIHMYGYHLNIPRPDRLMTYKGYSHPLYESQLAKPKIFEWYKDSVLCPIIHSHYLNIRRPEQKMLILVFTAAMSQVFLEHLRVEFSSLKILPFLGPDPEKNLEEADIIVSTPKSAGTGRDIKQLRTALNTVSYSSDPLARQMLGRLRKLPNGDTPVYVDTFNRNIESQVRHATNRGLIYRDLGLTYHEGTL